MAHPYPNHVDLCIQRVLCRVTAEEFNGCASASRARALLAKAQLRAGGERHDTRHYAVWVRIMRELFRAGLRPRVLVYRDWLRGELESLALKMRHAYGGEDPCIFEAGSRYHVNGAVQLWVLWASWAKADTRCLSTIDELSKTTDDAWETV